jgi:hypothetical protein
VDIYVGVEGKVGASSRWGVEGSLWKMLQEVKERPERKKKCEI